MKCRHCGNELEAVIVPRQGAVIQHVNSVQQVNCKREQRNRRRRAREQAYRDCGMVKVRGALGGVYWE
jgi:hypothetical protein